MFRAIHAWCLARLVELLRQRVGSDTHTHTHARTHAGTHTHPPPLFTRTHTHTHARTHAHAHAHTHTHTHADADADADADARSVGVAGRCRAKSALMEGGCVTSGDQCWSCERFARSPRGRSLPSRVSFIQALVQQAPYRRVSFRTEIASSVILAQRRCSACAPVVHLFVLNFAFRAIHAWRLARLVSLLLRRVGLGTNTMFACHDVMCLNVCCGLGSFPPCDGCMP